MTLTRLTATEQNDWMNEVKITPCCRGSGPLSPGAAIPSIYTLARPNLNFLNPNVTVGKNSVGIAAPGKSGMLPL